MPLEQIAKLLMENDILLGRLGEVSGLLLKQHASVRLWATSSQMFLWIRRFTRRLIFAFQCSILVVLLVLFAYKTQVLFTFHKSLEIGSEGRGLIIPKNFL